MKLVCLVKDSQQTPWHRATYLFGRGVKNMQWGDFLIVVVVISGKFILLVPGSHMFLNHYGMWFPTMDERLLRKNTLSVQKLKWLSFPPFSPALGKCSRGQFMPRGSSGDNFQNRVFQSPCCKHVQIHVHLQPTCQQTPAVTLIQPD